jgi:tetratricopeptide (TPR) repeat protein
MEQAGFILSDQSHRLKENRQHSFNRRFYMKKNLIILFILLIVPFFILSQVVSTPDSSTISNWKMTGSFLLKTGQYPESVIYLDSVLDISPFDRQVRLTKAEAFFRMGNYNLSKHELDFLLQLNKNDTTAIFKRVLVNIQLGDYQAALSDANNYTDIKPGDAYGWYYKGYIFKNRVPSKPVTVTVKTSYKKAIKNLEKAIEINGGQFYEAFVVLGNIYKNLDERDNALDNYRKAIAADSNQGLPYMNIGEMQLSGKDTAAALASFYKAIDVNPEDQYTITQVNKYLVRLGIYDQALSIFDRWINDDSTSLNGWLGKGSVYLQQKKFPESLACFDKAVSYHPGTAAVYYYHGLANIGLGEKKAGKEDLRLAAELGNAAARKYLETDLRYSESWLPFLFGLLKQLPK